VPEPYERCRNSRPRHNEYDESRSFPRFFDIRGHLEPIVAKSVNDIGRRRKSYDTASRLKSQYS
jgi:hypothetical protein